MVEVQSDLTGLFVADMLRHVVNVIHQRHRIAEGVGIDILNQERFGGSVSQQEIHLVGAVHIAHLNGFISQKFIIDPK